MVGNTVITIAGNLATEPELRVTSSAAAVCWHTRHNAYSRLPWFPTQGQADAATTDRWAAAA